jgi:hypothetical protein
LAPKPQGCYLHAKHKTIACFKGRKNYKQFVAVLKEKKKEHRHRQSIAFVGMDLESLCNLNLMG